MTSFDTMNVETIADILSYLDDLQKQLSRSVMNQSIRLKCLQKIRILQNKIDAYFDSNDVEYEDNFQYGRKNERMEKSILQSAKQSIEWIEHQLTKAPTPCSFSLVFI
jgi:hypothetical protein